jgi:phosphoribosylamine---glycine ligase
MASEDKKTNGNGSANGNGNGNGSVVKKASEETVAAKRKFLFVSAYADIGDLAWKIVQEGNAVKYFIQERYAREIHDGFLEKVEDWKEWVDWADVVVFDDVGYGKDAESLRKKGKLVIGGSIYTDQLEMDREFGQSEMKRAGMLTLPHWDFEDFDAAISFLKENPGRYVFKPTKGTYGDMKGIVFLGEEEDGKDILEVLEHNKAAWQKKKVQRFQIQKLATGVEVAVGAFFNGEDFIYPINVNFEHKKLFPGDIGPYTGEMGTLIYWSPPNTIFNETLGKMKEDLKNSGYVGYIDINCIANARGIYPLEFTSRFGYPTISIHMEGIQQDMGDMLYSLVTKEKFELKTRKGFQVGVVVAVPPFPFFDDEEFDIYKDMTVIFRKPNIEGMHLGSVKLVDGDWKIAGEFGYALVVTGSGLTVPEARKQCYGRIAGIMLLNMFYRTDIGERWTEDSDRLHMWGYLY